MRVLRRFAVIVGLLSGFAGAGSARATGLERFYLPGGEPVVARVAQGPDGNLWTVLAHGVGRLQTSGLTTVFPTPGLTPTVLTAGADGALWIMDGDRGRIGRLDMAGRLRVLPATISGTDELSDITAGPDGAICFTQGEAHQIGRIAPTGQISEFPLDPKLEPEGITSGPDGNVWFTAGSDDPQLPGVIGRMTLSGAVTTFPLGGEPFGRPAVGPDGNLWVAGLGPFVSGGLARVTPLGAITYVRTPAFPESVTTGPDGALWVATLDGVVRLSTSGHVLASFRDAFGTGIERSCSTTAGPAGPLAFAADGTLWVPELDGAIERLATPSAAASPLEPFLARKAAPRSPFELVRSRGDGAIWLSSRGAITRIDASGRRTNFRPRHRASSPALAPAADGGVWFETAHGIGHLDVAGKARLYDHGFPTSAEPASLAPGTGGTVWFVDAARHAIGVLRRDGRVREFSKGLGAHARPFIISAGRHGEHWVTDQTGAIERVSPSGRIRRFTAGLGRRPYPTAIAPGPDENMWFTDVRRGRVGRITAAGKVKEFAVQGLPAAITAGPDGAVWFNTVTDDFEGGGLGRITSSGRVDQFPVKQTCEASPTGLVTGPDGKLWFTEPKGPVAIGRMDPRRLIETGVLPAG